MSQLLLSQRLPDDLVYGILTLVPVKSLIRYRCVSKSWCYTITNRNFITAQFDRAKSLSNNNNNNNNGYLLYLSIPSSYKRELCMAVYNSDRKLTEISRFQIPCYFGSVVGYCRGMFYSVNDAHIIYFWNPSIRKFKEVKATPLDNIYDKVVHGLAYHYQNNDYKILRIIFRPVFRQTKPAEAEIYTLSTDSWRRVVISVESSSGSKLIKSVISKSFAFLNGALHCMACSQDPQKFIMCFDVNDERFREILLPQNYLDGLSRHSRQHLAVFKGSLALIVLEDESYICHIWMMKEYGVAESWIKKSVPMKEYARFLGFTVLGELLIQKFKPFRTLSLHPESLKEEILEIPGKKCMYTDYLVESLFLLDGI